MNLLFLNKNHFHRPFLSIFLLVTSKLCLRSTKTYIKTLPQKNPKQFIASITGLVIAKHFSDVNNNKETQKQEETHLKISKLVARALELVEAENYSAAKTLLYEALHLTDVTKNYTNVAPVYDLLVAIAINEGNIGDAEEMLVRFIEKLLQLGYAENDNQIVRYKLKLCRLYQILGNTEMAEIGFRSCVSIQENKLEATDSLTGDLNEKTTRILYLSSLFWYGRFLTEGNDLLKAKLCMEKALQHEKINPVLQPSQRQVVLFHTAEISFKLGEYQDAVMYMVETIQLCLDTNPNSEELPVFVVKLGVIFLFMGLYEQAKYWCEKSLVYARQHGNERVEEEANICLQRLREFNRQISSQLGNNNFV